MDRTEKDSLGEMSIPANALYGIHSGRARENFPSDIPFHIEWYRAIGLVKRACYRVFRKFHEAIREKYDQPASLRILPAPVIDALEAAAIEVSEGINFGHFIVPGISGGAGTSINMNVNEIITNSALISMGKEIGDYDFIDPIEDANIFQSTNDVIPSSLTIATMALLQNLETEINRLRKSFEEVESNTRDKLRPAYTQMQEAVPSTFGALFSGYNDALSRDWWRVSKCKERIKVINLGGGAAGTGISIPRFFIMEIVTELRSITSLPVTRSENLQDATSNLDSWVEMHSTLKSHAVNLEKMASDLRLLSSDISNMKLIKLPARQVGSSIMPGKINPVIPEYIISSAHKIYANDQLISSLAAQGCLDLNAYLPVIGNAILESLKLLISCNITMTDNLVSGLQVNADTGYETLMHSLSVTTALIPYIGYNKAAGLADIMKNNKCDIIDANAKSGYIDKDKLIKILEPANLLKLGFTLSDIDNRSK